MSEDKSDKSVGSLLKETRQAKNISLEGASKNTRIHVSILKSMESDDFKSLGEVYAKSFLKLYAEYLSLDKEDILRRFQQVSTSGASAGAEKKTGILRDQRPLGGRRFQAKYLIKVIEALKKINLKFVVILILVLIVVLGFAQFIKHRRVFLEGPKKIEARGIPVKKSLSAIKPFLSKEVSKEKISPPTTLQHEEKIVLVVRTKEKSWLQVKVDGKVVFQSVLAKGTAESWEAMEKIELWLGNAGAVQLELNGKLLGRIGRPGQVLKHVVVTRFGFTIQR